LNTAIINDPFAQTLPNVHEAVRKSLLMNALHEKLDLIAPGGYAFANEFGRLRDVVYPQIGDTRILFPEFTPHDEPLHVAQLFQLADKFFCHAYSGMTAAELFLLGCGLYTHDWGMAVGRKEKDYLRHGAAEKYLDDSFNPLPDEVERLKVFSQSEGLVKNLNDEFPELTDDQLRSYVRLTHAWRSGARVRSHFKENLAVGEALANLCEGHWHDFTTLDDPERFPRDYEVAGQMTNLLALTLQLRLIDLFHITDDRTPYALWRFVSPSNKRSKEEWKKHRALHAITVVDFSPGRAIRVQGFTDDEGVWAELQDLRKYCEDQVKQTLDLCARHIPGHYGLDFINLEWSVTTGTLQPFDFSFSFERGAMFRILSDDIYDGDKNVFIRELLQNSIDAIRTRTKRHDQRKKSNNRRKRSESTFDSTVYFTANHQDNGDVHITCRDYGIGMDEHVIRNFFTVAGVSYYRSKEFSRQHLNFEPVSQFGIGILSCFMVSDSLEVKTFRDPECGPAISYTDSKLPGADAHRARKLHLDIPSVSSQFIVKNIREEFEVGTEVSLIARKNKCKPTGISGENEENNEAEDGQFQRSLSITEYLCKIAGFVEFPIHIEEFWPGLDSPKLTLILHPDCDKVNEKKHFCDDVSICQLSRKYPWELVAVPDSLNTARELMNERCFDLCDLLGEEGYEGWVVVPTPPDEEWDFFSSDRNMHVEGTTLRKRHKCETDHYSLNWYERERDAESKSPLISIYRDGILLNDVLTGRSPSKWARHFSPSGLPSMWVKVNLSSSSTARPNISRTKLNSKEERWDTPIINAISKQILDTDVSAALSMPPQERLYRLGWYLAVYSPAGDDMLDISDSRIPSLWLDSEKGLIERTENLSSCEEILALPSEVEGQFRKLASDLWGIPGESSETFEWKGRLALAPPARTNFQFNNITKSAPAETIINFLQSRSGQALTKTRLQFLEPDSSEAPIINQFICVQSSEALSIRQAVTQKEFLRSPKVLNALQVATMSPESLKVEHRAFLQRAITVAMPVPFSDPFSKYFSSLGYINSCHPTGQLLLQCICALVLASIEKRIPLFQTTSFNRLVESYESSCETAASDTSILQMLGAVSQIDAIQFAFTVFDFVENNKLIDGFVRPSEPNESEFVESLKFDSKSPVCFGQLISEWPIDQQK